MPSSHPADGWAQLRFAIIGPFRPRPITPEKGRWPPPSRSWPNATGATRSMGMP
jgi:hypothetical protein